MGGKNCCHVQSSIWSSQAFLQCGHGAVGLIVLTSVILFGCGELTQTKPLTFQGNAMGTSWNVALGQVHSKIDREELRQAVVARIEEIENQMSQWRKDSLLSRFNESASTNAFEIPPDMGSVIREANRIHQSSDGAFDITAAPLVNLWGFGPQETRNRVPPDTEIEKARRQVGQERLRLSGSDVSGYQISKSNPNTRIDLSALAKGFAIDQMAVELDQRGITDYLIEFGGELKAKGRSPEGRPWRIGLEWPTPATVNRIRRALPLRDQAVATSGNYRLFFADPESSAVYSHIIDPRTGRPVDHRLLSVSVLAQSAMTADALATTLMVLGPEAGFRWACEQELAATFVFKEGATVRERSTPGFRSVVRLNP